MKIRTKLSLFTGLVVIVTTTAVAYLGYRLQKESILKNQTEAQMTQTAGLGSVCRQASIVKNDLLMINYVRLLLETKGITYAYFVDSEGVIRSHSDKKFLYNNIQSWHEKKPQGVIESKSPVQVGNRQAGVAVIGFSEQHQKELLKEALHKTFKRVSVAASGVAVAALVAVLIFSFILTRPLKALTEGSEEISKGNFAHVVTVQSRDELGNLGEHFNSMAQSLAVLDELKDEFISSVSHDLRSPMSAISMYTNFMLSEDPDRDKILPQHKEFLGIIQFNAARLGVFVTNVLDAAKIKAGQADYHPMPMSLDKTVKNIRSLFGMMASKKKIELVEEISPEMTDIMADPERLDHVLINLLSNALKFTQENGKIILGAQPVGNAMEIFVQDTGKGISQEDQAQLFERFRQVAVEDQRAKRIKGTGLGLYIVKQTVEGMGGQIRVESELGKGTRFIITLPKVG